MTESHWNSTNFYNSIGLKIRSTTNNIKLSGKKNNLINILLIFSVILYFHQ